MADEKSTEDGDEAEAEGSSGSKKRFLIIGVLLFLILAGVGVGGFFMMSKGSEPSGPTATPEGHEAADGHGAEKPAATEKHENSKGEHSKEGEKEGEKHGEEGHAKEEGEKPGGKADAKGHDKKTDEGDGDPTVKFGIGKTFAFAPFSVNLGNPLENHYVKIDISVEYRTPIAKEELEARVAQLRDAIISIVSSKTREFLLNPDGKEQLRLEILRQINHHMKNKIEQVFITELVIE